MWGGTPDRNMVSNMKGLPTTWDIEDEEEREVGRRARFAELRQSSGRRRQVYVGTNNELLRDPEAGRRSRRADGFPRIGRRVPVAAHHEKLAAGRANDWPYPGGRSLAAGGRRLLYYVTNRCEVWCSTSRASDDGTTARSRTRSYRANDAEVIWKFDMMEEVGAQPHNMANSSPVSYGDLIYVSTSNGQDESHVHVPSPARRRSSRRTRRPASWSGKTIRWREDSARPVVHAGGRQDRRRRCRWSSRKATAGCAATRRSPARSCGSSTPIRRIRFGRRRAMK